MSLLSLERSFLKRACAWYLHLALISAQTFRQRNQPGHLTYPFHGCNCLP